MTAANQPSLSATTARGRMPRRLIQTVVYVFAIGPLTQLFLPYVVIRLPTDSPGPGDATV